MTSLCFANLSQSLSQKGLQNAGYQIPYQMIGCHFVVKTQSCQNIVAGGIPSPNLA
jgi:hypothetical protein